MQPGLSDAFYPILLSKIGDPVTEAELDAYFRRAAELAERGLRVGQRYVVIVLNDPTKFSAAARQMLAEVHKRYLTPEHSEVALAAIVPIDSALTRGVITALSWLAPRLVRNVRFVPTVEDALRTALAVLEANGTPFLGNRAALRSALGL